MSPLLLICITTCNHSVLQHVQHVQRVQRVSLFPMLLKQR